MNTTNNEDIKIETETEQNIVIRPYESPSMKIAGETPLYKLLVNSVEASTQLMELTKVFQDDVIKSYQSSLIAELEGMRKDERNMKKGEIELETEGEVLAWNAVVDLIISNLRERIQ